MRRVLVVFVTLVVLWAVVAQLNDFAARANLGLFAGGLFVTYSALALPLPEGLAATLLGGLVCDANTPVSFGTHALLFAIAHLVIFNLRGRLPRHDDAGMVLVALGANLGIFAALALVLARRALPSAVAWGTVAADLMVSQMLVALIAPWFFALQAQTLAWTRAGAD